MTNNTNRRMRGYSLVEVLIAMGLLSVVLIAIVTLFFFGRANVYSGKQMTEAVAVGNHVMEDLAHMSVDDIYDLFQINSANALGNYTVNTTAYTNVLIRSTNSNVIPSPPATIGSEKDPDGAGAATGFLTTWRNEIANNNKFTNGSVTLILQPTLPSNPLVNASGFPVCKLLKIRIIVTWNESGGAARRREAVFDTVKIRRG